MIEAVYERAFGGPVVDIIHEVETEFWTYLMLWETTGLPSDRRDTGAALHHLLNVWREADRTFELLGGGHTCARAGG